MDRQTLTMLAQVLMLLVVGSPLGALIWNGSTHLEWEHSSGMGVPSGHSEVSSAKLEYTPSVVAQKRPRNAKSHQGGYPSSPEQETPLLACGTLGMILLCIQSLHTRVEACKCQTQWWVPGKQY